MKYKQLDSLEVAYHLTGWVIEEKYKPKNRAEVSALVRTFKEEIELDFEETFQQSRLVEEYLCEAFNINS